MTTRRDFIKTSGFLVVGFSVAGDLPLLAQGSGAGPYPDVDFRQLDSWIVIRQAMTGTLCRCMTYYRIQAAIKRAAQGVA